MTLVEMQPRKKAKRQELEPVSIIQLCPTPASDEEVEDVQSVSSFSDESHCSEESSPSAPKGFLCPLTMEVMFDPVLDCEGNTYERSAIMEWLREYRTSPVSRQPLCEKMLNPNNALREAIHEFMGKEWVARKQEKYRDQQVTRPVLRSSCRDRIDCFLQFVAQELGGLKLALNKQGCCAFRFDAVTVVIDVPDNVGVFCLYTRNLVPTLNEAMKDLLLEMNFLQGDTRGGCLSVKKHEDGKSEVMFSYTDRVAEVSARDFLNIILNFIETSLKLRQKLMIVGNGSGNKPTSAEQVVPSTSPSGISPSAHVDAHSLRGGSLR